MWRREVESSIWRRRVLFLQGRLICFTKFYGRALAKREKWNISFSRPLCLSLHSLPVNMRIGYFFFFFFFFSLRARMPGTPFLDRHTPPLASGTPHVFHPPLFSAKYSPATPPFSTSDSHPPSPFFFLCVWSKENFFFKRAPKPASLRTPRPSSFFLRVRLNPRTNGETRTDPARRH